MSQGAADIEDLVCRKASCEPFTKCAPQEKDFPEFLAKREVNNPTHFPLPSPPLDTKSSDFSQGGKSISFEKNGLSWVRATNLSEVFEQLSKPSK